MDLALSLTALVAFVGGAIVAWLAARAQLAAVQARLEATHAEADQTRADCARREGELDELRRRIGELTAERAATEARIAAERESIERERTQQAQLQERFRDAFKALSSDALKDNNAKFLELAQQVMAKTQEAAKGDLELRQQKIGELVKPLGENLQRLDTKIQEIEKARTGTTEALKEQLGALMQSQRLLQTEASNLNARTGSLVEALKNPTVRGRWGELQLRRVVEMAGMLEHCDFEEQETVVGDGRRDRPDLTVKMPGDKLIAVDAKTPLSAYLEAMEAGDEPTRQRLLDQHARQLREHIVALGKRDYGKILGHAPDFVVLFIPGESFFSAALERDPTLIETGIEHRVFLASPTTLITLLRSVAYGWGQQRLEENAREIGKLGADLYERLGTVGDHVAALGKNLGRSVDAYNKAVASLESRVLVTARKFKDLHAAPKGADLQLLEPLEQTTRALTAQELVEGAPAQLYPGETE